ncbi:MAG: zinc-ribbon domain-containing protein [Sphingorhabdus sp.]
MVKFCTRCGKANTPDALFCAKCGTAIPVPKVDVAQSRDTPVALPQSDRESPVMQAFNTPGSPDTAASRRNKMAWTAAFVTLFLVGALYFWLFVIDDIGANSGVSRVSGEAADTAAIPKQMFTTTEANIRDKPTTAGSMILGKLPRGSAVTGTVKLGDDGVSEWLELTDGKGFIAVVNLTDAAPPEIIKDLNDKVWTTDGAIEIWSRPATDSELVDRVSEGTRLTLSGVTANDFIEIKLRKGGVGYVAGGADILARLGGKPIAINFNPGSCKFGDELESEFAKIGARLQAQWADLDNKQFPDETARENAYAAAEGKSSFVRLPRSFDGLSITAIAQHFEAQSIYFAEPPAKVIEVFRANGFKINADGTFPSTELYAGISATRGESAAYGKSELGCGV